MVSKWGDAPMRVWRERLTDSPVLKPGATVAVWPVAWMSGCRVCEWGWSFPRWDLALARGIGHLRAAHAYGRDRDGERSPLAVQP